MTIIEGMESDEHLRQSQSDHDLLIRIDTNLTNLITQQKNNHTDHELRIRRLEMWGGIALGLSYAIQFYMNFLQ